MKLYKNLRYYAYTFDKNFPDIEFDDYFDDYTGFDIIKFDEYIKPDENESLCHAIERKHNKRAADLIKDILDAGHTKTMVEIGKTLHKFLP